MRSGVVEAGSPGSGANSAPMPDAEPRLAGEQAGRGAAEQVPDVVAAGLVHPAGEHASEPALMLGGILFALLAIGIAIVAVAAYLFA